MNEVLESKNEFSAWREKIIEIFNFKNLNKVMALVIVVMAVYYVTSMNDLTVKGFCLQDLKKEHNQVSEENNKMQLRVMALESYRDLSSRAVKLKMVAVGDDIDYVKTDAGTLVARR